MNQASTKHIANGLFLTTERLELVAGTVELAEAQISDLAAFANLLEVPTPEVWPPPLNDEQSQRYFLDSLRSSGPEDAGWNLWFCILRDPRVLVGVAGFKGAPKAGGAEVGYSMLEAHQRKGYCTEAVAALIDWAFAHRELEAVIAHTLPELIASIRVMEKCGLVFDGEGPLEDGIRTVRYELTREAFEAGALRRPFATQCLRGGQ